MYLITKSMLFALTLLPIALLTDAQDSGEIIDIPYESQSELEAKTEEIRLNNYNRLQAIASENPRPLYSNQGKSEGPVDLSRYIGSTQSILFIIAKGMKDERNAWIIPHDDQSKLSEVVKGATELFSNTEIRDKLESRKFASDTWKEITRKQVDFEYQACKLLADAMPPNELERFFVAHRSELLTSNIWFAIFSGHLGCDKETVEIAKINRSELLLNLARSNSNGTAPDFQVSERLTKDIRERLTFEQFMNLLILRGQKSSDVSNEDFILALSDKQKRMYSIASPAFKSELNSRF